MPMVLSRGGANNSRMRSLIVKQLDYDLTPVAGLALVGHHLKQLAAVFADIDRALPVRTGVAASDMLRSYVGLLTQGKRPTWISSGCPRASSTPTISSAGWPRWL
jgi:hypothetical protein